MSAPTPYRVRIEVGSHVYDVESGDPTDVNAPRIDLPLTIGWQVPESTDFFPTQANPTTGSFVIACPDVGAVSDIAVGDLVLIEVWLDLVTPDADTWQRFRGVVSQVDATLDASAVVEDRVPRHLVTVYVTDPTWLLSDMVVGLVDWPIESIGDRVERICAEAGIGHDRVDDLAGVGMLPARSARPTNALEALRSAFRDDANENDSHLNPEGTGTVSFYGRPVFTYNPDDATLYVRVFERRVTTWPATLGADGTLHAKPGVDGALDGGSSSPSGKWSRIKTDRYTYVIVDDHVLGDPDAPGAIPFLRSTGLVDTSPSNPSATARDILAESLVPEGEVLDGVTWRTDVIRHFSYLDPDPVAGWIGGPVGPDNLTTLLYGYATLRPVIVEPVDVALTLDGRTWIAGTLTSARLVIPPGGKFYVDLALRPDLYGAPPPTVPTAGAMTYADIPAALTYADLDPLLTYRDLRLAGD